MFQLMKKSLVIKCYTPDFTVYETAPLTMKSNKNLFNESDQSRSIRTCYGYISALKKSITVPNWSEFNVVGTDEGMNYYYPEQNRTWVEYHNDPCLKAQDIQVTKIWAPWAIENTQEHSSTSFLPLVSLFPLTERNIVLETYYDPDKFHELNYRSKSNPFFRGGRIKLGRLLG